MKNIIITILVIILSITAGYIVYIKIDFNTNEEHKTLKPYLNTQFYMTDADRALYAELVENNPADILLNEGEEYFDDAGDKRAFAKFLNVSRSNLSYYIAGFPRYIEEFGIVVGLDQVIQAFMYKQKNKKIKLSSAKMFSLLAYVKSIANGRPININIKEDVHIYKSYMLGKKTFNQKRGMRGLSCMSCHSKDIIGSVLRTQPLPDLSAKGVAPAATWPAYRMTKSSLRTLQRRFQGCMKNALHKVIPLGSAEMVGLEVYLTKKAIGAKIAIPGIKR